MGGNAVIAHHPIPHHSLVSHHGRMDIVCGGCRGENVVRDPNASSSADIPLLCLDCGWRGVRTPKVACPRCGSRDLAETSVDSWAYADLEEARERPESAPWGYVDKAVYRCLSCRHEWSSAGEYRPYQSGDGAALTKFVDDDAGYQQWLSEWPKGFVLNCNRHPSPDYLILHRASCRSISQLGRGMQTFTGEYVKVCSTDRAVLRQWARDQTGAEATYCQFCL